MSEKKKTSGAVFGIAATWFGMHCGSGFATGRQYTIYYSKYGWMGLITPFITWALLGVCFYFIFEYCRRIKAKSYKDYAATAFVPSHPMIFIILFDLWCVFGQILGEAGILAGSGSLFEQIGVNYWIGVLCAGAIVLYAAVFGAKGIMKFSKYLSYGLIVCIIILGIAGTSANWENLQVVVSTHESGGYSFWDAVKASFTYAGVQISSLTALAALCSSLQSQKESGQAALRGALINVLMLQVLGLVMIANYPDINEETLPVLTAIRALNVPALTVIYEIMLFMALVTTGAGCAFAVVSRFSPYVQKGMHCSETVGNVIVAVILMAIGVFASQFGLTAIFSTGYSYLAKLAWPLGILPALFLLPYRLSKMDKNPIEETASAD